jgi:hypothetical protein
LRKLLLISLLGVLALGVLVAPIQADFIQCVVNPCNGTVINDIVNGTPNDDTINAGLGNDLVFGGEGNDNIDGDDGQGGDDGDDFLFGGPGDDLLGGWAGNDILLAGPDGPPNFQQVVGGGLGNDIANVLLGETIGCLVIQLNPGADIVNLIGFGPFSAQEPFGQPGFNDGYVHVIDPIGGGDIFIDVSENSDAGTETINGLLSPNVTIVPGFGIAQTNRVQPIDWVLSEEMNIN